MKSLFLITSLTALVSCESIAAQTARFEPSESEDYSMTMSVVTAGDHGGTVPALGVSCPDDGTKVEAAHIREPVAALLANDEYLKNQREVEYEYVDSTATAASPPIAAPNFTSGNTWTATSVLIDVADCKEGDDIKVQVWGSWQLNSTSNATTVGRARVAFYLDPDGSPLFVPIVRGIATISDDGGALTLPHNENYALKYRYRVTGPLPTNPVKVRAVLEARSEDLSGGAGTATIVFLHSARMDLTHIKRN